MLIRWGCGSKYYDDAMKRNRCPHCYPLMRGIHRSPVDSPYCEKDPPATDRLQRGRTILLVATLHMLLNEQSSYRWREIPWGLCDVTVIQSAKKRINIPGKCQVGSHLNITMTSQWVRWCLKPLASRWIAQPFVQAQIKENIKALRHWPLCGEFTGYRWILLTKVQ